MNEIYQYKLLKINDLKKLQTRWVPIRTISLIPVRIKIAFDQPVPLYQKLSSKIKGLKALGMSNTEIEAKLNISKTSVRKGLNF